MPRSKLSQKEVRDLLIQLDNIMQYARTRERFATKDELRMLLNDPGCNLSWREGIDVDRAARIVRALGIL